MPNDYKGSLFAIIVILAIVLVILALGIYNHYLSSEDMGVIDETIQHNSVITDYYINDHDYYDDEVYEDEYCSINDCSDGYDP